MFCYLCSREKNPMLFAPAERRAPAGKRCMECMRKKRKILNPQKRGAKWRISNKTFFPSVMGYQRL